MRIPMKRIVLQILALLLAAASYGKDTAALIKDAEASKILEKKCIRLGTSEVLKVDFETACSVLRQSDLVEAIQEEFAQTIAEDGKVEFPIIDEGGGKYYYENEKGKRTDVRELYRKRTDEHTFDYVVWARGKRFFGGFDVVIHLQVADAGFQGIIYSVYTHAYPHNWATRFSARNIGTTKRYFRRKMKMISYVAREIGLSLCSKEAFRRRWLAPETEQAPKLTQENPAPLLQPAL